MVKIEESVTIDRPADQVWNFIMDFSNAPKWMPEILELRQTSAGPVEVGATLERKHKCGVFPLRVIEYEPKKKVVYEFTSGFVKGTTDSYSLETVDGKTSVSDMVDVKLSGLYGLLGPLFSSRVRKAVEDRVSNLKRLLESEAYS